jgi:dTDP-4-amino-4,6-dideoxygalactose transaminase
VSGAPRPGHIPFNRANVVGEELAAVSDAIQAAHLSADGAFTARCARWLEDQLGSESALLVHSCTAALELAVMLADIGPGDEVIMPSFTFVSTANAVVLRGGVPVFVDVRPDTLNIDETLVEAAITDRTRALLPIHYAGVGAELDVLIEIADARGLCVIEDAAQGLLSSYRGRPLGGIAPLGATSFHETKNVTCGEGGALLVNDERFVERAEILREKGTNRAKFFRGQVDKYTWVDIGSSYALSDLSAAFLAAQLDRAREVTDNRLAVWDRYHEAFADDERAERVRRPIIPDHCVHNAHMYYLLLPDLETRTRVLKSLNEHDVNSVFHYVPLHSSPAGRRFGRVHGEMTVTDSAGDGLLRLPMWNEMPAADVERVIDVLHESLT